MKLKEFTILCMLLAVVVADDNDLENKKADVAITAIPPLVTFSEEDASSERPKIPKLKVRPFNRRNLGSLNNKPSDGEDEDDEHFNEAIEYSTKIETIEEIRIVTERPYFAKKLIPKLKVQESTVKKEDDVTTVGTSTTTTTTTTTTVKPEEKEVKPEVEDDSKDETLTVAFLRPSIRPILTRRPTARRRPLVTLPTSTTESVTEASDDGQTTTRKKFVRRRYKKVDYKNGTIEKVYVGPSVEVDPALRQVKLNAVTTEAPDLPTPIIYGRTTKRGRLTPKRLIGRTTSVRPRVQSTTTEVREDEKEDEKVETESESSSRRPSTTFEPTKQRKFIKRLKAIRERTTTTSTTPEPSSTEEPESATVVSNDVKETLFTSKDAVNVDEDDELNEITSKKPYVAIEREPFATPAPELGPKPDLTNIRPVGRTDTAERVPFPVRARPGALRPLNQQRPQSRPKLLLEKVPVENDEEEEEVSNVPVVSQGRRTGLRPRTRLPSRQRPTLVEQNQDEEEFVPRRRFGTRRPAPVVQDEVPEVVDEVKPLEVTSKASNAELLKSRTGSRLSQPTIGSRFSGRKTTEKASTTEVTTQQPAEETTVTVEDDVTTVKVAVDANYDEVLKEQEKVVVSSSTSTTSKPTTVASTSVRSSFKPVTSTFKPRPTTTTTVSTTARSSFKPSLTTLKPHVNEVEEKVPVATKNDLDEFNRVVQQKHKEVIESIVTSLPGFNRRPTTSVPSSTTTTPRTTTTARTTTTTKASTTQTSRETQTASPVVHFFINDDSFYSLKPSRTFVPQIPFLSDAFRQVITDLPSRVVQQLPLKNDVVNNNDLRVQSVVSDTNSASRFRVTVPSQPPTYTSTVRRQPPTTTRATGSPIISTTQLRTVAPTRGSSSSRRPVPTVDRRVNEIPETERPLGPNRGRGGSRFNPNELRWNNEIWSLDGEDAGYFNFIKV